MKFDSGDITVVDTAYERELEKRKSSVGFDALPPLDLVQVRPHF